MDQKPSLFAVPFAVDQHRSLVGIPVMLVVRRELEVPCEAAVVGAQGEYRCGVEVVSLSIPAVEVLGTGVAGRPVKQVEFRVVGSGRPRGPATESPGLGVIGPGLGTGFAGRGHRVEAPSLLASLGIERVNEAPYAP